MVQDIHEIAGSLGETLGGARDEERRNFSNRDLASAANRHAETRRNAREAERLSQITTNEGLIRTHSARRDALQELGGMTPARLRELQESTSVFPADTADALVAVLNKYNDATSGEITEIHHRQLKGEEPLTAGRQFGTLLAELIESRDISARTLAGEVQAHVKEHYAETLATLESGIASVGAETDRLRLGNAEIDLGISYRRGENVITTNIAPGKISDEHIRLIERGALPSRDLLDAIIDSLDERMPVSDGERREIETRYAELAREYDALRQPRRASDLPPAATVTEPLAEIPSPPVEPPPAATIVAPPPPAPVAIHEPPPPEEPLPVVAAPPPPPPLPAPQATVIEATGQHSRPAVPRPHTPVEVLATRYDAIFRQHGLIAPPDISLGWDHPQLERDGQRTELVERLFPGGKTTISDQDRRHAKALLAQLRPFRTGGVSSTIVQAVADHSSMAPLLRAFNDACREADAYLFKNSARAQDYCNAARGLAEFLATRDNGQGALADVQRKTMRNFGELLDPHHVASRPAHFNIDNMMIRLESALRDSGLLPREQFPAMPDALSEFARAYKSMEANWEQQYRVFGERVHDLQATRGQVQRRERGRTLA